MKDVTVIGGGPAGLYASFYAGVRGMSVQIVDFQDKLGGKMHIYPEKVVWDVGGVLPRQAHEVMTSIIEQGLHFNPDVHLGEKVVDIIKHSEKSFEVRTESGLKLYSKAVIVAVGAGIIQPTELKVEGAERFKTTNLNYAVQSLQKFKDKKVLISGGGNTALDWAHDLSKFAKQITLCYRKEDISGHECLSQALCQCGVIQKPNRVIKSLVCETDDNRINKVVLASTIDDTIEEVEVDEVIVSHGFDREAALLQQCQSQMALVDDYFIEGQGNTASSVPGIFACGDIVRHPAKSHLIASAFADAANAANLAKQYILPCAQPYGKVSSHNDVFKSKNKAIIETYAQRSSF